MNLPMTDTDVCLSAAAMREADRRCIEEIGIPGAVLMDHAGKAVFAECAGDSVGVLCGKGNNGGDGYVVARYALLAGLETHVVSLVDPESLAGDAKLFADVYQRLGGDIVVATERRPAIEAADKLADCATVVDALLGTGITGEVRGVVCDVIEHWPQARTVAVDLPSGLNADTGLPCGVAVHADVTVTMAWPKLGFRTPESERYTGRVMIADIGIPRRCADPR